MLVTSTFVAVSFVTIMYCPQCSQQQISDEMRFCSRCGFPLAGVKEILTGGGVMTPTVVPQIESHSKGFKGAKQATWMLLAALAITFPIAVLSAIDDDFAVLILVPALCLLVAFVRLLYAVFFEDRLMPREKTVQQPIVVSAYPGQPIASVRQRELPVSPGIPVDNFTSRGRRTAEVVQPPSVTENTTKLLDDHAEQNRELS